MRGSGVIVVAVVAFLTVGCGEKEEPARAPATTSQPAQTAAPTPTPTPTPTRKRRSRAKYRTIPAALRAIARHVDVPVALPTNLPKGTSPAGVFLDPATRARHGFPARPRRAQLILRLPDSRKLWIAFGWAGFDGCGPTRPERVTVVDQPAILQVRSKRHHSRHTTVVWPTTEPALDGRYSLSGSFSRSEILGWAESMEQARAQALSKASGC